MATVKEKGVTDEDQMIVEVVKEHGMAKRRLACLRTKEDKLVRAAQAVIRAFDSKEEQWPADVEWPTPDEMSQLMSELNQTRERITELEDRRKELGID